MSVWVTQPGSKAGRNRSESDKAAKKEGKMTAHKLFRKGEVIKTMDELLECRTNGVPWVYWNHKIMHYGFLSGMPFRTIFEAIKREILFKAVRN
jgi:hypothetical protein